MSRCGRCKGRGHINPIRGIGQVDCPDCKGSGEKVQRSSLGQNTFTIPLPGRVLCHFCWKKPATEQHHVVSQSRAKKTVPRDLWEECLTDPRDGIPSCRNCHDQAESDPQLVKPDMLHRRFFQWVDEWDLESALPRHLTGARA